MRLRGYGGRVRYCGSWRWKRVEPGIRAEAGMPRLRCTGYDCPARRSLHQAALVSHDYELGAVAGAELGHDAADVGLGGGGADYKGFGDLFVVHAAGDEEEDLALPFGEFRHALRDCGWPLGAAGELGDEAAGDGR